jgi:NCS1 family nucleobase:cation symporter-1
VVLGERDGRQDAAVSQLSAFSVAFLIQPIERPEWAAKQEANKSADDQLAPVYAAFTIEQRGIDIIPPAERKGSPRALFWMWAGGLLNVEYVVNGALVIVLGLSFRQALFVIILGNVMSWAAVGVASLQGPDTGTTSFVLSRAPFGVQGARAVSFFNWLTLVGYETEGLLIVVLALLALSAKAGLTESTGLKVVLILIAAAFQMLVPLFGHATISKLFGYLSYAFIVMFALLAIVAVPKIHVGALHQHATTAGLSAGIAFVFALAGFGWTQQGNDYSRYEPAATRRSATFWAATLGPLVPAMLLMILGAAIATTVKSAIDPISGLPSVFPTWVIVPYLIGAIIQLFCINSLDLYSSGLTLQAVGFRLRRWQAVLIDTVICAVLTYFLIVSNTFSKVVSDFVLFTIVWLIPWFAIFMTDWLMRGRRYELSSLGQRGKGVFWRNSSVHLPGVAAQALGIVGALLWLNASPAYIGPLASRTGGLT